MPSAPVHPAKPTGGAANAPSVFLPLRFIVVGVLSLALALVLIALKPAVLATYHYNQHVIAITHLLLLGWIGSVVVGAVYQLVPVALETRLYSERLARWQFLFHLIGFAGMVWMFWRWDMKQVGHFGSAFAVGVGLFVWNIARTLARVPRWNVIAFAIAAALGWLVLTVLVGLSIAAGKCAYEYATPLTQSGWLRATLRGLQAAGAFMGRFDQLGAMHAHAHAGVAGCFVMLIVGVSYRLLPMFAVSELQSPRRAAWSVALLNVGLLGAFLAMLTRHPLKPFAALVIAAGLALYALEVRAILRARRRTHLDWGLRQFLAALALLIPGMALGLFLSWPGLAVTPLVGQLENLYGLLGVLGVVSLAILGMLYKIVPFLVWFGRYRGEIGRHRVPNLADLYATPVQVAGFALWAAGLFIAAVGTVLASELVVRLGALVLGGSWLCLGANLVLMFRHLVRPRLEPLPDPAAGKAVLA
jgi:hypothetical protein